MEAERGMESKAKSAPARVARVVLGFVLLAAGILMLALPGPGWLAIFVGLTILASEFHWARRLLDRLKKTASKLNPRRSA